MEARRCDRKHTGVSVDNGVHPHEASTIGGKVLVKVQKCVPAAPDESIEARDFGLSTSHRSSGYLRFLRSSSLKPIKF